MSIGDLIDHLHDMASKLECGYESDVVAWVRVPNVGESAVLEVSGVAQGYRITHGGQIATLNLDERA